MNRRELIRLLPGLSTAAACLPPALAASAAVPHGRLLTLRHAGPGNGRLLFIGTQHTHDRNHPELLEMQQLLQQFRPDVALIEGGHWPVDLDLFDLVSRHGEMAFAKRLCRELGAVTDDADPPLDQEIRHASEHFDIRLVKLFYVLRAVPGFLHSNAGDPVQRLLAWMNSPQLNVSPSMRALMWTEDELNETLRQFAPRLRTWRDAEDSEVVAPTASRSMLNELARLSVAFREAHAVSEVIVHMRQGRRVLLVMGAGHVQALEGRLKQRLDTALALR